jgi:SpoVK/Ycf46/Vps4 family AAA+-type ATPase
MDRFLHLIQTGKTWDDIPVGRETLDDLESLGVRLQQGAGASVLFTGPPGTGKTQAASVLANELGMDLYRVDLAQVVSKYIGETEKNLVALFEQTEEMSAVLLFDEADALFGKRSDARDSHDRYANPETQFLLQRIEDYPGIVVLTSNSRDNLDKAFVQRMTKVVGFVAARPDYRLPWWRRLLKWFGVSRIPR